MNTDDWSSLLRAGTNIEYIYLTSGSVISVRHKLETGGTISFTNALSNASIDNYLSLQIERIYDTNPEA